MRPTSAVISGLTLLFVSAQHAALAYEPEFTAWGVPNIEGVWDFRTLTPMVRPAVFADKAVLTPEEAKAFQAQALAAVDVDNRQGQSQADVEGAYNTVWWDWGSELNEDLRTSLIVDPANGKLPALTEAAKARLKEQNELRTPPVRDYFSYSAKPATYKPAGPESLGLSERCLVGVNAGPPFNPSAYNNNIRIVQTSHYTVILTEMIHDARIVLMSDKPHSTSGVERWSGESRGHWEGNTLVVETRNFTDKTPAFQLPATLDTLEEAGAVGSGKSLNLTERFTPTREGRLLYEYTVNDPLTFERPFTVAIPMRASDERMYEYACHEGNYAMKGILKGARLLEAEAHSKELAAASE